MKTLAFFLVLLLQAPPVAPLASLSATLRQLRERLDEHRATFGATRGADGGEAPIPGLGRVAAGRPDERVDIRAFAGTLHTALAAAGLFCGDLVDECDWNFLGYVDDIRVSRAGEFLVVVTAIGISCGFDESAYVYAWESQQWRRVWEHERNTYTPQDYLPQTIHDVQISSPDASRSRLLMTLGSQTICGGAFKDLYARVWRMDPDYRSTPRAGLDRTRQRRTSADTGARASGRRALPIHGRRTPVRRGPHGGSPFHDRSVTPRSRSIPSPACRVISSSSGSARRGKKAGRDLEPRPWKPGTPSSIERMASGIFRSPTLRCTAGPDVWQVETHLYERPKRYFRVRWQNPYSFTLVDISETPYPDCTVADSRGETYTDVLDSELR